jgi:predicted nucleotide-binding protein (sugar kinase/HSP70/actin superfamily)
MIKVGIPRALLYYQYYPMWRAFFEQLGADVVVSPPTTQVMLSSGSSRVVADTCLPVKVFLGHVLYLVERCDYLFIPAIRSVQKKVYNCSKFLGLPDMTKAVIPEAPPILDIDIDVQKGKRNLYQAIYQLGRHFTWDPFEVRRASLAAWQAHLDYQQLMSHHKLTSPQAIERLSGTPEAETRTRSSDPASALGTVALVGHPYLLYDEHISHRLIRWLEQAHYKVLTPEMLTKDELEAATVRLVGRCHWACEDEVVGAGEYYLGSGVDGVIGIMVFGCGPDSLMMDVVRRRAASPGVAAFMSLTMEEHTAVTGVVTRLEAFLDMIYIRKRRQAEVCA